MLVRIPIPGPRGAKEASVKAQRRTISIGPVHSTTVHTISATVEVSSKQASKQAAVKREQGIQNGMTALPFVSNKDNMSMVVCKKRFVVPLLAIAACLFHTLYYGTQVSSGFRKKTLTGFYHGTNTRNLELSSSLIYPKQFQELKPPTLNTKPGSEWTQEERLRIHNEFRRSNRESLYSLLLLPPEESKPTTRIDTNLQWGRDFLFIYQHFLKRRRQGLYEYHDVWGTGMEEKAAIKHRADPQVLQAAWGSNGDSKKPRLIHELNLCHAFQHAKDIAGFNTPHVLVMHLNENWGGLSSFVPYRTYNWGRVLEWNCNPMEVKELYLDSPNTLAVFTTQHQAIFDHPKVHSIPIGVANSRDGGEKLLRNLMKQEEKYKNSTTADDPRPQLLMINNSPTEQRKPQMDAVIRSFHASRHPQGKEAKNTYGTYKGKDDEQRNLYQEEISRSKFIMCPSGIGWDTYRIWESIILGAIPVIERHKYEYGQITYPPSSGKLPKLVKPLEEEGRKRWAKHLSKHNATIANVEYNDGWKRSLDELPVVWINDRSWDSLTPEFLDEQYDAIAARAGNFRYEKMTSLYWLNFIESFLFGDRHEDILAHQHAMETLSDIFNDHTEVLKCDQRDDAITAQESSIQPDSQQQEHDGKVRRNYIFGDQQPKILSWVLLLQLKLLGLAMIFVAFQRRELDGNIDTQQ